MPLNEEDLKQIGALLSEKFDTLDARLKKIEAPPEDSNETGEKQDSKMLTLLKQLISADLDDEEKKKLDALTPEGIEGFILARGIKPEREFPPQPTGTKKDAEMEEKKDADDQWGLKYASFDHWNQGVVK